ncbi:hypothetical protein HY992_03695 [Candidatus Micrarchaeota archaeon]|nr:hypothetical protein [Candidatus Micrarchaeota archaeon]
MVAKSRVISRVAAERLAALAERRNPSAQEKFARFKGALAGGFKPALGVFNGVTPKFGFRVFEHDLLSAGMGLLSGVNPLVDSIFIHLAKTKMEMIAVVGLKRFYSMPRNAVGKVKLEIPVSWTEFEVEIEHLPVRRNGHVGLRVRVENLTSSEQSIVISFFDGFSGKEAARKRVLVPSRQKATVIFNYVPFDLLERSRVEVRRATNELQE